jgi:hypothetical protein
MEKVIILQSSRLGTTDQGTDTMFTGPFGKMMKKK